MLLRYYCSYQAAIISEFKSASMKYVGDLLSARRKACGIRWWAFSSGVLSLQWTKLTLYGVIFFIHMVAGLQAFPQLHHHHFAFPFSMNENLIIGIILFTCPHYTLPEQHDMPPRMMDKVHKRKKKMSQMERVDRMAILSDEHMAGARICSTKFGKCFFPMKFPKKNKIMQRRKKMQNDCRWRSVSV